MLQNRSLKSISYLCNILLCSMLAIIRHEFDKCGYGWRCQEAWIETISSGDGSTTATLLSLSLSLSLSFSGRFAFHDGLTRQLVSNIVWQTHKAHSFVRLSGPRDHLTLRRRLSLYTHIAAGCVRSHLVSRRTRKPCCRKETKPCHVLSTSPLFHLEFREDPLIPVEQISAALMPHGR